MNMIKKLSRPGNVAAPRKGAAAIFILLLTSLLFIAVVFSVDIARIQLAQLELQSGTDFASRAGAEALSRGVGDPDNDATTDALLRAEVDMIARLNRAGGDPIELDLAADIKFGRSDEQPGGSFAMAPSTGSFNNVTNSLSVSSTLTDYPVIFGGFVSRDSLNLNESSASMVSDRDMVMVLDRSASMLIHDAGDIPVGDYPANLHELEDAMYGVGEFYYTAPGDTPADPGGRNSEFEETAGMFALSRIQALKLAVLKFRNVIEQSRSLEKLGLATYSDDGDLPADAHYPSTLIDIEAGLSTSVFDSMVGNGITDETEKFASPLEGDSSGYRGFDYNYLAMRRRSDTNIIDGLTKGAEVLFGSGRRVYATPILILMTDGIHNMAGDPETTASNLMAAHPEMQIYTVTFGAGADQAPMSAIASIGRGKHYHADNVYQLVSVFEEIAESAGVILIE